MYIKFPEWVKQFSRYFELSFKGITYPLIKLILRNKEFEGKLDPQKVKSVLFIRHDYVGDMIVTLPAVQYIKNINPNIKIDFYCSKNNYFILSGDQNINNIYIKKGNFFQKIMQLLKLRHNKYDVVFNTQYVKITKNGWITNLAAAPNSIKTIVGIKSKYSIFFNKMSALAHSKDIIWLRMLYLVNDIFETKQNPEEVVPYIYIPEESKIKAEKNLELLDAKQFFAINLSARQIQNIWTKENYSVFCKSILEKYPKHNLILFYVADDKVKADYVQKECASNRVKIYPDTRDIKEICHAVSKSEIVLSPDTGFIHIASAVRRPILGLYGGFGTNTFHWRPYKTSYIQIEAGLKDWVEKLNPNIVSEYFDVLYQNKDNIEFQKLINQHELEKSKFGE